MLKDNQNLKDTQNDLGLAIKDVFGTISYTKTNKLIMAVYMVTDIIDKDEPIRHKLRTLGLEIISDIQSVPANAFSKISEVLSFLDIASAINIISQMNCSILRKEFLQLAQSIKDSGNKEHVLGEQVNLSEFLKEKYQSLPERSMALSHSAIGHASSTRIGVQKGSTLMKALSEKTNLLSASDSNHVTSPSISGSQALENKDHFDILRKERREKILNIVKNNQGNVAIKDIKTGMNSGTPGGLPFSEKTLQRELTSMVNDGVLTKKGEKRWSRYSVAG